LVKAASVGWTVLAAAAGFAGSYFFTSRLHWSRDRFVAVQVVIVAAIAIAYVRTTGMSLTTQFRRRWLVGLVVGFLVGALLVSNVAAQPGSSRPTGGALVLSLFWLGLFYGVADAVLLTILPVLSLYGSQPRERLTQPGDRLRWAGVALAGSLVVTAVYHLGFTEFRGRMLFAPLLGNALITACYLFSGSPLAPIVAHVMMHGAAVVLAFNTAVQLPPHY
jgi:hypothetical protein